MSQYDRAWFDEVGRTVKVTNLYSIGEATLTVEEIKKPAEGQVLEYRELLPLDQETRVKNSVTIKGLNIQFLTVEQMSLVIVDIADNAGMKVADGEWCVFRLGALLNGKQVSFGIVTKGNFFKKQLGRDIFAAWEPGEMIWALYISYFPDGELTREEGEGLINRDAVASEEDLAKVRFTLLGRGSVAINRQGILDIIAKGGILGVDDVSVDSVDR